MAEKTPIGTEKTSETNVTSTVPTMQGQMPPAVMPLAGACVRNCPGQDRDAVAEQVDGKIDDESDEEDERYPQQPEADVAREADLAQLAARRGRLAGHSVKLRFSRRMSDSATRFVPSAMRNRTNPSANRA